jgi:osomolarity two-component system sensor histidine kinase TcsA
MSLSNWLQNLRLKNTDASDEEITATAPPKNMTAALADSTWLSNYGFDTPSKSFPKQISVEFDPALGRIYRYTPIPTLILDKDLCVVEVSDSHCSLSGQSRDVVLGTCACDLPPHSIPAPDTLSLYGAISAAISSKEIQIMERIRVGGTNSTYQLRVTPIIENSELIYVVLEAQNISRDHWEASDEHHAYVNETYKILVNTVQDYAIFMLDTQGNIATWNRGAEVLKGYSPSDIIGKHFSIFYSPDDRAADKPAKGLALALQKGRIEAEGWRYRQDGTRFWANVMITPIYQFGRHVGFVKVTRDLTERKAAETRMIAAYEESSKMKTDFLANMSHEIRTPMNGMQLALAMLKDTDLSEQQLEYASIIDDSTTTLLQIINDVLDYSKLSSGSFSLNSDVLDIKNVITAVMRNCRSLLRPEVELTLSIPANFPQAVRGDPLRYRQVVQNMLGNAVKFTESGYIRISVSFQPDELDPQGYLVRTEFDDSGLGVPGYALNTLFTPFTRFADSTFKKYQGTGLGLSICKSLAELMNGMVGYRPGLNGKGSVFWFTARMGRIDLAILDKKPAVSQTHDLTEVMRKIREIAPHKHILLVEDNLVNNTIMLKLLRTLGFERVDVAWDGAEAVRLVKQKTLTYNMILMDISMPVMDGLEATSRIREVDKKLPIVALTANALKGDRETYLARGMNDYIGKPVHRDQLVCMLWKWMGT